MLNFRISFTLELMINSENEDRTMRRNKGVGSVVANKEHPKTYRKHEQKRNYTNLRAWCLQEPLQTQYIQPISTVLTKNTKGMVSACLHSASNHPYLHGFTALLVSKAPLPRLKALPGLQRTCQQYKLPPAGRTALYPNSQIPQDILPASFLLSVHSCKWKKQSLANPALPGTMLRALIKKECARTHKS